MNLFKPALKEQIEYYFKEDDLNRNLFYASKLPNTVVNCSLYIKSNLVLAGLPFFFEAINFLGGKIDYSSFLELEGKSFSESKDPVLNFKLPFSVALTSERIALNLLQHASSIATHTKQFVDLTKDFDIKILDTRKTLPGLRSIEKYAVRTGGGYNHRLGQTDLWMIKDNHKTFFGGVKQALDFFKDMQGFYVPVEVEIHDLKELKEALSLGVKHLMLDNFSPSEVKQALELKTENVTYEVSGGIRLDTVQKYLIKGIDAISIGALTYNSPSVDISFKYKKMKNGNK